DHPHRRSRDRQPAHRAQRSRGFPAQPDRLLGDSRHRLRRGRDRQEDHHQTAWPCGGRQTPDPGPRRSVHRAGEPAGKSVGTARERRAAADRLRRAGHRRGPPRHPRGHGLLRGDRRVPAEPAGRPAHLPGGRCARRGDRRDHRADHGRHLHGQSRRLGRARADHDDRGLHDPHRARDRREHRSDHLHRAACLAWARPRPRLRPRRARHRVEARLGRLRQGAGEQGAGQAGGASGQGARAAGGTGEGSGRTTGASPAGPGGDPGRRYRHPSADGGGSTRPGPAGI
ncbi:MAG: hypothetical protein AVDCRST_MAG45-150, partial [uncultured Solirubrobacterales bacterium]